MDLGIKGKRALVTGGATGIGKAIVQGLANEGVQVVFTSRSEKDINKTLKELGSTKKDHLGLCIDLLEDDATNHLSERIWKEFGQLDIVVNNIGHNLGITDPLCSIDDWRKVFRINLEIHIEINNLFIPHMKNQSWGRILNISAGSAMENNGPVTYCTSKAALTAYSRCMGRVLASEGIVMSALQPGVVVTERGHWGGLHATDSDHAKKYLEERTVLKRFGEADEISPMAVLLCSDLASFCQGAIITVDGGQAKHYFQLSHQ